MKEIKFRGKALEDGYNFRAGEFACGSLVFEGDEPYIVGPVVEANEDYIAHEWWVPVDPATVGQYTGLKDKHGREIYTDDIIRIGEMGGEAGRVIYNTAHLAYMVVNEHQWTGAYRLGDFDGSDITIVGNIYENPKLLDVDISNYGRLDVPDV